jgi:hypothetical protein
MFHLWGMVLAFALTDCPKKKTEIVRDVFLYFLAGWFFVALELCELRLKIKSLESKLDKLKVKVSSA